MIEKTADAGLLCLLLGPGETADAGRLLPLLPSLPQPVPLPRLVLLMLLLLLLLLRLPPSDQCPAPNPPPNRPAIAVVLPPKRPEAVAPERASSELGVCSKNSFI